MKKFLVVLLCAVGIMTFCICPTFAGAASAESKTVDIAKFEEYADTLNGYLEEHNTNVDEQLGKVYTNYVNFANGGDEEAKNIARFTMDIKNRNPGITLCSSGSDSFLDDILNAFTTAEQVAIISVLRPLMAVFSMAQWDLTYELLVHSFYPGVKETDVYIPRYGYIVKNTAVFKNIVNDSVTYSEGGEFKFPSLSNFFTAEADAALAIHYFKFAKPTSSSKTVIIQDTYDYDKNDKNTPWYAILIVSAMVDLHDLGIASWYKIEIREANGTLENTREQIGYTEFNGSINANELLDFNIKFSTGGYRIIHTYKDCDAVSCLLDEKGELLSMAEEDGFNGSLFLCYNFEANKNYTLRYFCKEKTASGYVKVSVIHNGRQVNSFNDLNLITYNSTGTYSGSASQNNLYMVRFSPNQTAYYKIKFNVNSTYSAFLIPLFNFNIYSTAFRWGSLGTNNNDGSNSVNSVKPWPEQVIDPGFGGGGNDPDTINKMLKVGEDYLLIVSGYPITNSINFSYNISI